MTAREAAGRLECSLGTVYELCENRLIGHRRVGSGRGAIRIDEDQLAAYLARTTVKPAESPPPRRSRKRAPVAPAPSVAGPSDMDLRATLDRLTGREPKARRPR